MLTLECCNALGLWFYLTYLYFFSSLRDKFLNVIFKIFFGPSMAQILKETIQNVKAEQVFLKNAIALFLFFPRHVYCFNYGFYKWMRLQRRLSGISTVCFLIFMISCNYKLGSFFAKSLNQPFKDHIQFAEDL